MNNNNFPGKKLKLLFLCTGNSCRSQMAEGLTRHLKGELIEPYSAGVDPHKLDPRAVEAMAEIDVDISHHESKHVDSLKHIDFDYVITVCGGAHESCPTFPRAPRVIHIGFDDPPSLALAADTEEEALDQYRRVRDEIAAFVKQLPEAIDAKYAR